MKRLRVLRLVLALLLMVIAHPARAASVCTAYVTPPGPIPPWVAPGVTLCLRAGDYPHSAIVRITAIGATYQSAPGEHARLLGPGLDLSGHDFTLSGIEIDNDGAGVPAVVLRGDRETLANDDIHHGGYNLIDVRGSGAVLRANTIHDAQPSDLVPGNDTQGVNVLPTASGGAFISNSVWSLWGDGLQFYGIIPTPLTQPVAHDWIISGNVFTRGALAYSENGIDIKEGTSFTVTANDISGYDNTGHLGTCQPAVVMHGVASHMLFDSNNVHDSCKGIELTNGQWSGLTISGNRLTNLTQYAIEIAAGRGVTVTGNTISGTLSSVLVASSGWVGGRLDYNLIVGAGAPRLVSGSGWGGVALGPNAWVGSVAGFLQGGGDLSSAGAGFGVPAPWPTQTATAPLTATPTQSQTATATQTATSSPTPTNTATATATPTATPVRHTLCLFSDGRVVLDCP